MGESEATEHDTQWLLSNLTVHCTKSYICYCPGVCFPGEFKVLFVGRKSACHRCSSTSRSRAPPLTQHVYPSQIGDQRPPFHLFMRQRLSSSAAMTRIPRQSMHHNCSVPNAGSRNTPAGIPWASRLDKGSFTSQQRLDLESQSKVQTCTLTFQSRPMKSCLALAKPQTSRRLQKAVWAPVFPTHLLAGLGLSLGHDASQRRRAPANVRGGEE